MLDNANTTLSSTALDLRLDPYTTLHVPTYRAWMTSPALLAATASLPLPSEEAEASSCAAWRASPEMLSFLLVSPATRAMIGDVSVVFSDAGGEAEEGQVEGEVGVMVAAPAFERRGLASAALWAAMAYAVIDLSRRVDVFVAKIGTQNAASIAMFSKLGFAHVRTAKAFDEVHMEWRVDRSVLEEVRGRWIEGKYSDVEPCFK